MSARGISRRLDIVPEISLNVSIFKRTIQRKHNSVFLADERRLRDPIVDLGTYVHTLCAIARWGADGL